MRTVSEQRTVLVNTREAGPLITDFVSKGWQVDSTQPGRDATEMEIRFSRQHDINSDAVGGGETDGKA